LVGRRYSRWDIDIENLLFINNKAEKQEFSNCHAVLRLRTAAKNDGIPSDGGATRDDKASHRKAADSLNTPFFT
jgi:hypothetical protein